MGNRLLSIGRKSDSSVARIDGEDIRGLRRAERVKTELLRRETQRATFAGQFALRRDRRAGGAEQVGAHFAAPDFGVQRFADGVGLGGGSVVEMRLDQILHPRGKNPLAREVAGKFAGGKIQDQHRAEAVMHGGHGGRTVAIFEQHAARAGRAGLVIIVKLQQREVLARVAGKQFQVRRFEIAAHDLLRAGQNIRGDFRSGQTQGHRVRADDFFERGEIFGIGGAVEKINQSAAAE